MTIHNARVLNNTKVRAPISRFFFFFTSKFCSTLRQSKEWGTHTHACNGGVLLVRLAFLYKLFFALLQSLLFAKSRNISIKYLCRRRQIYAFVVYTSYIVPPTCLAFFSLYLLWYYLVFMNKKILICIYIYRIVVARAVFCIVFCPLIRHQRYWDPEIQPACFDRLRGISADEKWTREHLCCFQHTIVLHFDVCTWLFKFL